MLSGAMLWQVLMLGSMAPELQAGLDHCSVDVEFENETELKVILKSNHHNMFSDLHAAFCCFLFSGTLLAFCSLTRCQLRNTDPNCYSEFAVYEADVTQNIFILLATNVEPTRQNNMVCFHFLDRIFSFLDPAPRWVRCQVLCWQDDQDPKFEPCKNNFLYTGSLIEQILNFFFLLFCIKRPRTTHANIYNWKLEYSHNMLNVAKTKPG